MKMKNINYKKIVFILIILPGFLISLAPIAASSTIPQDKRVIIDYKLKASFFLKFADYCYWPSSSNISDLNAPFVIGAFERDDITDFISERIKDKKVLGKELQLIFLSRDENDEEYKKCNLVYIPERSRKKALELIQKFEGLPVLTLGDTDDYEKIGVMINLVEYEKKLRFVVNRTMARKNGLDFKSRFLTLAKSVH